MGIYITPQDVANYISPYINVGGNVGVAGKPTIDPARIEQFITTIETGIVNPTISTIYKLPLTNSANPTIKTICIYLTVCEIISTQFANTGVSKDSRKEDFCARGKELLNQVVKGEIMIPNEVLVTQSSTSTETTFFDVGSYNEGVAEKLEFL